MCFRQWCLILKFVLVAIMLQSCVSWKKMNKIVEKEPPSESFSSIRISNCAVSDSSEKIYNYYSFYRLNKMSRSWKNTLYNWKETIVQLDSLEKGISVSFFLGENLSDQYFLKGKWKNNFFYAKRRIRAKGIPPLYFFYDEKLCVIGKHGTELCLIQSEMKCGMIVLFSAGSEDSFHEHYSVR